LTRDLEAVTAAAVRGDVSAMGEVYGALAPTVCGYLTVRGAEDPEGLTNEVFLKVFPLLPSLTGGWEGLRTLVFSVTHARLVDDHRRRARGSTTPYVVEHDRRTRESAESELPEDQRSVVVLRVVADLSVRQTATAIGRDESAVVRLQGKALASLRRLLRPADGPQVSVQGAGEHP
jgi:RNA polymerase sigma-70 factor (ECF subfamily)